MEFEKVLRALLEGFERERIRYALMGGFALGALGAPRATMDLDFLVHREDLAALHALMTALGYSRRFESENVSQYHAQDRALGYVDFLHAFRRITLGMLERAAERPVFEGQRRVRVLQPEDVIGLKVQAMANDPERQAKEEADIEALMGVHRSKLDWARLREYFELFSRGAAWASLKERFDRAE